MSQELRAQILLIHPVEGAGGMYHCHLRCLGGGKTIETKKLQYQVLDQLFCICLCRYSGVLVSVKKL